MNYQRLREATDMESTATIQNSEWEFENAETDYLTHNFHSYPAKFIPQIPSKVIGTYSKEGDVVLDPFCGCGGALVEAKLLGRHSVGVDINPLACLVTKVKVTPVSESSLGQIDKLLSNIEIDINSAYGQSQLVHLGKSRFEVSPFYNIDKWFQKHVQKELAIIKGNVDSISEKNLKDFCLVAFSSIINRVSNMESETRYACVSKKIAPKKTFELFQAKLKNMASKMREFALRCKDVRTDVYCADARKLDFLKDGSIDLVVTSPPYIYAWDYNLIHRFRLFWLSYSREYIIDLQNKEIGSHLRLERKQKAANDPSVAVNDYVSDMSQALSEMSRVCKNGAMCCTVLGSSQLEGKKIEIDKILIDVARKCDFELENRFIRVINPKRKATNLAFARIRREHVLLFRKI
jgi:site-specific DNA-methyltransferase (cytosine-N4-specific)